MSLGLVSPILNRGVRSRWVSTLPAGSKMLTIDAAGDVSYTDIPTAAWGSITGTLSSQTDLQNALNAKLSLTGGTLTGGLSGTTATFSGDIIYKTATNNLVRLTSAGGEGVLVFGNNTNATTANISTTSASANVRFSVGGNNRLDISGTQVAVNNANLSVKGAILDGTTNILEQRNGANAQTFRVYNTFTDASNYERGKIEWSSNVLRIGTEKAGTGSARALELQTDGTTRLTIEATSGLTVINKVQLGTGGSNGNYAASINGKVLLRSSLGNGVNIGYIGDYSYWTGVGTSQNLTYASYQAETHFFTNSQYVDGEQALILKSSEVVLGKNTTCNGNLTLSTKNIVTDTTTGTKIGTATTQKIGFYNATPVVQPAAVADATDAASVITQLNLLLSRMRDLGLIAT